MDVFCITTNNPQFQKLLAESGEKQGVFAMTISKWMTQNEVYDRYPTLQELGITVMEGIKPGVEELFDSNPELANAVYEALGFKKDLSYDTFKKVIRPKGYAWSILDGGKKITINSKEFNFTIATGDNIGQAIQWVIDNKGSKKELLSILEVFLKEYQNKSPENYKPLDFIINEAIEDGNFFQKLKDKSISLGDIAKNNAKRTFDDLLELYYEVHNSGDISKIKTDVKESSKKTGYEFLDDRLDYFSGLSQQQKQQALQLYSQYLDTIFPDSKVKDIVYHISNKILIPKKGQLHFYLDSSTRNSENYKFHILKNLESILINKETDSKNSGLNNVENYIFDNFNYEFFTSEWYKNPLNFYNNIIDKAKEDNRLDVIEYLKGKETNAILNIQNPYNEVSESINKTTVDDIRNKNKTDGIIGQESWGYGLDKTEKEIVVFEPEQIHILGSNQDIKGFKDFAGSVEDKASESGLSLSSDEAAAYNSLVNDGTIPIKCK